MYWGTPAAFTSNDLAMFSGLRSSTPLVPASSSRVPVILSFPDE